MRNRPPFECPRCGIRSPVGVKCEGCRVDLLDQDGLAGLGRPLLFYPSGSFRHALAELGSSIRFWRARRARGDAARTTIAEAADGLCRVAGRVHVVRPVVHVDGTNVAAHSTRRRHTTRTMVTHRNRDVPTDVTDFEESSHCGRFAVIDPTGVAIVDDDCFELWSLRDDAPVDLAAGAVLREGDTVEVLGPARGSEAPEARELLRAADYRTPPRALVFDGRPAAGVRLFVHIES